MGVVRESTVLRDGEFVKEEEGVLCAMGYPADGAEGLDVAAVGL